MKFKFGRTPVAAAVLSTLFSFSAFAGTIGPVNQTSQLIHFDPVQNQWSDQVQTIQGMNSVYSILTVGKYSVALEGTYPNPGFVSPLVIAFNDGKNWTPATKISNMPYASVLAPLYPSYPRNGEKPDFWITGYADNSTHNPMVSYFDGNTFSPAVSMPQLKDKHDFIISNHQAFVVDLSNHTIMRGIGNNWTPVQLPISKSFIIRATAKNGDGDFYVLAYSDQVGAFYIASLLPDGTWSKPYFTPTLPGVNVFEFQVVSAINSNYGEISSNNFIIKADLQDETHYFESTDNAQTWFDYGVVPITAPYSNHNWGHVFWKIDADDNNHTLNLMYADATSKTITGWTSITLPAQMRPTYPVPFSSFNGHTGWISIASQNASSGLAFYNIDNKKLMALPDANYQNVMVGENEAYAASNSPINPVGNSYYFDGKEWHSKPFPKEFQVAGTTISLSSAQQGQAVNPDKNVWIFNQYLNNGSKSTKK